MEVRPINIFDVAKQAGVSKSTVSRVLTGDPRVRRSTRTRVEATIRAMGYWPNGLARGLITGQTHTIGLIVYGLHNPFFGLLAHGVEVAARSRGYNVLIASSNESLTQQQECLAMLAERRVDGVLIAPICGNDVELAAIQRSGLKAVLLNSHIGNNLVSSVGTDDAYGGYLAVRHLLDLGHRYIGFVGQRVGSQGRIRGYRDAHAERNVAIDEQLILDDLVNIDAIPAAVSALLGMPNAPTALFTLNDEIAIFIMQVLAQRGLQVPDDIAVVGYDDLPVAARLHPPLTTVAQPKEEQSRLATKLLIDLITDSATPVQRILLQPRLMVRQSCGAALKADAAKQNP